MNTDTLKKLILWLFTVRIQVAFINHHSGEKWRMMATDDVFGHIKHRYAPKIHLAFILSKNLNIVSAAWRVLSRSVAAGRVLRNSNKFDRQRAVWLREDLFGATWVDDLIFSAPVFHMRLAISDPPRIGQQVTIHYSGLEGDYIHIGGSATHTGPMRLDRYLPSPEVFPGTFVITHTAWPKSRVFTLALQYYANGEYIGINDIPNPRS